MEALPGYFIQVNVVISLLFAAWYLGMRHHKFLRQNRFVLLAIIGLSFLLPFAPPMPGSSFADRIFTRNDHPIRPDSLSTRTKPGGAFSPGIAAARSSPVSAFASRFLWGAGLAYLLVSGLLLLRLANQLLNVFSIIRRSRSVRAHGITYCDPPDGIAPFSFFGFLVVNREAYPDEQYLQIISHEYVHSVEWHSLDSLLAELAQVLLWPNPLVGLLKRCLRANLEFLADDRVIRSGINKRTYQLNMLRFASAQANPAFTTGYGSSIIKERIARINTPRTPSRRRFYTLLLLPALALGYGLVSPACAKKSGAALTADEQATWITANGYYGLKYHHDIRVRVSPRDGRLQLLQLWDGREVTFHHQTGLAFRNDEKKLRVDLVKDKDGKIAGLIATGKDRWVKLRDDDRTLKNEIQAFRENSN